MGFNSEFKGLNIIFSLMPRSPKRYHPLRFSDINPTYTSFASCVLHVPPSSNTYEGYQMYVRTYPRNWRTNTMHQDQSWRWCVLGSLGHFSCD